MVSLVDSTQQYILAEATQTLSLVSDKHRPGDEVWLGNTIIKRCDAVCHNTFGHEYSVEESNGQAYTTEGLIVNDMRLDDRFKDKSYVQAKPGVVFYAGVPIKTKSGHRIGVYAVSDEKPRAGLTLDELVFMEDMTVTIMQHVSGSLPFLVPHRGSRRYPQGAQRFFQRTRARRETLVCLFFVFFCFGKSVLTLDDL